MADFKRGAKVDADFGDGYKIAFVLSGPDGPEDKYEIQVPNGGAVGGFTYRETADLDAARSGLTFKKL
jgi:hypothetical protein